MKNFLLILLHLIFFVHITGQAQDRLTTCPNDTSVCIGTSFALTGGIPEGGIYSGPGVLGGESFNSANAGIGNHQITYSVNDESCTFFITVKGNIPAAGIITGPQNVCKGNYAYFQTGLVDNADSMVWIYQDDTIITSEAELELYIQDFYVSGNLITYGRNNVCEDGAPSSLALNIFNTPEITINGSISVCKNSQSINYFCSPDQEPYSWEWEVINGTIFSGQGSNSILVNWSSSSNNGVIKLKRILNGNPDCSVEDEINVIITNDTAPDPINIIAKNNDLNTRMLICPDYPDNYFHYEWGYQQKNSEIESVETGCVDQHYCEYSLPIDTTHYNYWVKISKGNECVTKSYYNESLLEIGEIKWNDIIVFPNPFLNIININLISAPKGKINIAIFSVLGKLIFSNENVLNNESLLSISLNKLPAGLYILILQDDKGNKIIKKMYKI